MAAPTKKTSRATLDNYVQKVLDLMESKEKVFWVKPWKDGLLPQNPVTQNTYRGINALLGGLFETPLFFTFNNVKSFGGKVKKGSKAMPIVCYKTSAFVERGNKKVSVFSPNGSKWMDKKGQSYQSKDIQTRFFFNYKSVFNFEDIEGDEKEQFLPQLEKPQPKIEQAEKLLSDAVERRAIAPIKVGFGDKACYIPSIDKIKMPKMELFNQREEYYSTVFHEAIHSTGHKSRLAREMGAKWEREKYSKEELIAEMGAALLCQQLNISNESTERNSLHYLASWLKVLKSEPQYLIEASKKAHKAVQLILNEQPNF